MLEMTGKVSLGSIVKGPGYNHNSFLAFRSALKAGLFRTLLIRCRKSPTVEKYLEGGPPAVMLSLSAKPFLIRKSTPSVISSGGVSHLSTSISSIIHTAREMGDSIYGDFLSQWGVLTGSSWLGVMIRRWKWEDETVTKRVRTVASGSGYLGKLAFLDEPAGKVRVIAMVDPLTQWAMRPLHEALFSLLREIPQDGTFDQLRPLDRLLQNESLTSFYSYDLSSATDRLPVVIQEEILSFLIGDQGSVLWKQILTSRFYMVDDHRVKDREVHYSVGQPMGVLSSWAMLALTHHLLVQWAAIRTGSVKPDQWFQNYAVLGDDIVIADTVVAKGYLDVMKEMDVSINPSKSLVSRKGRVVEFAKRFFISKVNAGPVPFKEFSQIGCFPALLEFSKKMELTPSQYLMMLGYGHKSVARMGMRLLSLPRRLRRYILAYYSPSGPGALPYEDFLKMKSIGNSYTGRSTAPLVVRCRMYSSELDRLSKRLERMHNLVKEFREKLYPKGESEPTLEDLLWFGKIGIAENPQYPGQPCKEALGLVTAYARWTYSVPLGETADVVRRVGSDPGESAHVFGTIGDMVQWLEGLVTSLEHVPSLKSLDLREDQKEVIPLLRSFQSWERFGQPFRAASVRPELTEEFLEFFRQGETDPYSPDYYLNM